MGDGDWGGLTRRQLLATVTSAGAIGAVGAGATVGLLSDEDTFPDNLIGAGSVDLELCFERDREETCQTEPGETLSIDVGSLSAGDSGSGFIQVRLSEDDTQNPAWLWGRTNCPVDPCGIYDVLEFDLWYDLDCDGKRDGDEPPVVVEGTELTGVSLCRLQELLADGALFDATPETDEPTALQPETERCLGLSWEVTGSFCEPAEATLDFQFVAEQRRHNPEPTVPWEPQDCDVACDEECPDECYPASFVSFCLDEKGDISRADVEHLSWTDDSVTFQLDREIDSVILYYGQPTFEIFDGGVDAGTRYTIQRGSGDEKLSDETAREKYGMHQSDPCPDWGATEGCGIKYEFEEDNWECVCEGCR